MESHTSRSSVRSSRVALRAARFQDQRQREMTEGARPQDANLPEQGRQMAGGPHPPRGYQAAQRLKLRQGKPGPARGARSVLMHTRDLQRP